MKIIIDIPEKQYEQLKFLVGEGFGTVIDELVVHGTPLPKRHGRLIDADALIKTYDGFVGYDEEIQSIKDAPTIIEAESEE